MFRISFGSDWIISFVLLFSNFFVLLSCIFMLATAQPTADGQCKSSVMEQNALTKCNLGEKSKGGALSHAKSCPSQFLETNIAKQHHLSGYKIQEFREKDIFNHSNSSAFSRCFMLIKFC